MTEVRNFIDGGFTQSTATLPIYGPRDGSEVGTLADSDADAVNAAVAAAKASAERWAGVPMEGRAALLDAIADTIESRRQEFAALESLDTGKPISLAQTLDIPRAIANFRFFAGAARHFESRTQAMADAINYTVHKPLGVVGLITPWNLPLYLLSWKLAPALAMGNTVVAKPSELTPLSADALATVFAEVAHGMGLPTGIFNLVHGLGPKVGAALTEHPDVKGISFTGGTHTGKIVAASAAPAFKKLSLELGGKNPTIVFEDADLDKAVPGALRAAFTNQGQICLCGSRMLVAEKIYDTFVSRLCEEAQAHWQVGDPNDPGTKVGATISKGHLEKIEGFVAKAKELGGKVLVGGKRPKMPSALAQGYYFEPTIIAGLSQDCALVQEEIFGPVVTVQRFGSDDEALRLANDVRYGLAASVWTENLSRAHAFSHALDTGMVWVNTWLKRDLRVPFGGMKDSGVGREGGVRSLKFFSEARNICIQL